MMMIKKEVWCMEIDDMYDKSWRQDYLNNYSHSLPKKWKELLNEGYLVAHAHLRYINPFPKNLESLIRKFDKILIPEINNGQLIKLIRDKYVVDAVPMNKIQGIPFEAREIKNKIIELYNGE